MKVSDPENCGTDTKIQANDSPIFPDLNNGVTEGYQKICDTLRRIGVFSTISTSVLSSK